MHIKFSHTYNKFLVYDYTPILLKKYVQKSVHKKVKYDLG